MLNQFIGKFNLAGEIYLRIKVRPDANQTKVKQILEDEDGSTIKIDVAAAAVRGRANQALIAYLAEKFAVNKKNISLVSGAGDRLKLVKIVK